MASSFMRFVDHTERRSTVSRAPLDEWSARRRDLYLTTHNTHNRQTTIPPQSQQAERLQTAQPLVLAYRGVTTPKLISEFYLISGNNLSFGASLISYFLPHSSATIISHSIWIMFATDIYSNCIRKNTECPCKLRRDMDADHNEKSGQWSGMSN
jgi:hypothetical protein